MSSTFIQGMTRCSCLPEWTINQVNLCIWLEVAEKLVILWWHFRILGKRVKSQVCMDYGFTHKTQLTMKIYMLVVKAVILQFSNLCISRCIENTPIKVITWSSTTQIQSFPLLTLLGMVSVKYEAIPSLYQQPLLVTS